MIMTKLNRPYIICHMMQTLDGKIASGVDGVEILMDYFDLYTKTEKKLNSNAWVFGRKTGGGFAAEISTSLPESEGKISQSDFIAPHSSDTFAVIADIRGVLRWEFNYIKFSGQEHKFHLIIIVNQRTPKAYLAYLQHLGISYVFIGSEKENLSQALSKLKGLFGIKKILLEGGGAFNGSMMADGLVDEISLLLLPRVLNKKDAPSLFDASLSEIKTTDYLLDSCAKLERGVLWLHYIRK